MEKKKTIADEFVVTYLTQLIEIAEDKRKNGSESEADGMEEAVLVFFDSFKNHIREEEILFDKNPWNQIPFYKLKNWPNT